MGTQKNISISLVHTLFSENPRWRTQIFIQVRSVGCVRMMTRTLVFFRPSKKHYPVIQSQLFGYWGQEFGATLSPDPSFSDIMSQLMLGMVDAQR
jgi:hypothetical protein